jgi:siroheme synthase
MDWKPSSENPQKARLSLVGAGPGDPDLITYKAVKVLQTANVVLYDALVDVNLLQHAPNVPHIYVGKRAGQSQYDSIGNQSIDSRNGTQTWTCCKIKRR